MEKQLSEFMMKQKNVALFALGLLVFSACGNKQQGLMMGGTPECAVQTLAATNSELTSAYPATIKGKQDVEIRPKVAGFITKLCVDEGSNVKKGQTLFVIDPVEYQAAVKVAEANVKVAEANVSTSRLTAQNKRELRKKNIISDYELQTAENQLATMEATLAQAKAQLVNARNNLSYTNVTSPSNGVVGTIPFRVGSLVSGSAATPLTTVSDISDMYVYFSMTEKQLLEMTRQGGQNVEEAVAKNMTEVQLQLSDGTLYGDKGKIETISGVIDPTTGSVTVRAAFPNQNHILRSGGTGVALIPYKMENAILVPQKATYEIQDKKFVFVLQPDNTIKNTEIQVFNLDNGKDYVVTFGLKAGDKVVIENVNTLKDGQQIKPITAAESEQNFKESLKK